MNIADLIRTGNVFDFRTKLPRAIALIFDSLFTERVTSFAGFKRSASFSIFWTAYFLLFWYLHKPQNITVTFSGPWFVYGQLYDATIHNSMCFTSDGSFNRCFPTSTLLLMPIFYSLLVDWIALSATQAVMRLYPANLFASLVITVLFTISLGTLSVILASILWRVVFQLDIAIAQIYVIGRPYYIEVAFKEGFDDAWNFFLRLWTIARDRTVAASPFEGVAGQGLPFWNPYSVYGVFVFSTLAGVLWVMLMFLASIVGRALFRLRAFGPLLDGIFPVNNENSIQGLALVAMFTLAIAFLSLFVVVELIDLVGF